MSTIAFIGLGIMGLPMAGHLVAAGHDVLGHNRSRGPVDQLISAGGRGADSVGEAVKDADVVITMVPDSPDVESVALGEEGIYAQARPGTVHIDMSSIRPDVAAVVERVRSAGAADVGFLCDLFHLANNGENLDTVLADHQRLIAHVQVADHPGRHEPGSGALDLDRYLSAIEAGGYSGYVALEYLPSTTTSESLAWLPVERRGLAASQGVSNS